MTTSVTITNNGPGTIAVKNVDPNTQILSSTLQKPTVLRPKETMVAFIWTDQSLSIEEVGVV